MQERPFSSAIIPKNGDCHIYVVVLLFLCHPAFRVDKIGFCDFLLFSHQRCNPMEVEQKHWISPKETEKLIIFSEEDGNSFLLMSHSSYCGHTIAYEDPSQQWGSLENYKLI